MQQYLYTPLSQPGSIRLLQLCPRNEDSKNLRCKLIEYPFRNLDCPSHPYDAVSYVWGSEDRPHSILIDNQDLKITQNLCTLLLRLQNHSLSRVIWVDAVCINQDDEKEKENQIPLMAEIYAKASRVLVWLGEAEDDSDQALKTIRRAGETSTKHLLHTESYRQPIMKLLQRPWFQRIWVLQEVAAARHILIMCGIIEIEGHAFCLGLDSLSTSSEESMIQVTFLIRGAIFRSRETPRDYESLSLDMSSLGELIDMYHTYNATKRHDKLYALLGMCSDDLETAGLEPNYDLGWKELMCRLVKFILGGHVSVETWEDREMAFIKSQGYIFGKVSQVERSTELGGPRVNVIFENITKQTGSASVDRTSWTLPKPAIPIQEGDFICLLKGTSKPTIVRLNDDHFVIIMIAAVPLERKQQHMDWTNPEFSQSVSLTREFSLVWNWELTSREKLHPGEYDGLIQTSEWGLSEMGLAKKMRNAIRAWNVAQTLKDIREDEKAMKMLQKAVQRYSAALGQVQSQRSEIKNYVTMLSRAVEKGHENVVRLLLDTSKTDLEWKDNYGKTPLSLAAANGYEAIVQQLLEAGADVKSKDAYSQTPLMWAAANGHESSLQKLIEAQANIESENEYRQTPLSVAAENGHESIVKLLLATGKVNANSRDSRGWTPLFYATKYRHESVVRLLLATKEVNADSRDSTGLTPLFNAAKYGHESVVRLLLATDEVNANAMDIFGWTPLEYAKENGHEGIIKLLQPLG